MIGGGPSAPRDLESIPGWQEMFIISANDHAFKIPGCKPSLIMCKDHTKVLPFKDRRKPPIYMEPIMRQYGVPIASRQYWADYRIQPWCLTGNSGMFAIALGIFLGGTPTIVTGVDCFQGGGTYFHSLTEENVSNGLPTAHWVQRFRRFQAHFQGAPVRALSGIAAETFRRYDPAAKFGAWGTPIPMQACAAAKTHHVRFNRNLQDAFEKRATIPEGFVMPCTEDEFLKFTRVGVAEAVDTAAKAVI